VTASSETNDFDQPAEPCPVSTHSPVPRENGTATLEVEKVLASSDWKSADMSSLAGQLSRVRQITRSGHPPMKVITASQLKKLKRLPRSSEGLAEDLESFLQRHGSEKIRDSQSESGCVTCLTHKLARMVKMEQKSRKQIGRDRGTACHDVEMSLLQSSRIHPEDVGRGSGEVDTDEERTSGLHGLDGGADKSSVVVVFFSHRWFRPSGEVAHPDDAAGHKAMAMVQFADWLMWMQHASDPNRPKTEFRGFLTVDVDIELSYNQFEV